MASDVVGTPAASEPAERPRRGWLGLFSKEQLWSLVELFVLTGFVVGQPLLDVTGKAPDFFIFRRASRLDILLLIAVVLILPALYLWIFELILSLAGERARRIMHLVIVTGLLAVLAMEVGKKLLPVRGRRRWRSAFSISNRPGCGRGYGISRRRRWCSRCCSPPPRRAPSCCGPRAGRAAARPPPARSPARRS
jgi:hypothetical protein